jgi:sigma-B regulation protein RsbU (phosphoserine phosphatase)
LVIADVADKGVPAALFMALSRTLMRAVAFTGRAPADALSRVNELILADARSDLFVTVFYGAWNPASGELVYANAGHNPPLLARADGTLVELQSRGIALGVVDHIAPESGTVHLEPGDVLLLYTDGIVDALNHEDQPFGLQRVRQVLLETRSMTANSVVNRMMSAVCDYAGDEPPFDDQTVVVLKRECE